MIAEITTSWPGAVETVGADFAMEVMIVGMLWVMR